MTVASLDRFAGLWSTSSNPWEGGVSYNFLSAFPTDYVLNGYYQLNPGGAYSLYTPLATDFEVAQTFYRTAIRRVDSLISSFSTLNVHEVSGPADIRIFGIARDLYFQVVIPGSAPTYSQAGAFASLPAGSPTSNWGDLVLLSATAVPGSTTTEEYGRFVAIHEFSHSLGFTHDASGNGYIPGFLSAEQTAKFSVVTYATHHSEGRYSNEYSIYDIAAIQSVYGRISGGGNNIYSDFSDEFNSSRNRMFSIFDSGGASDKIDASSYSGSSYIDLRPGFFSSIGPESFVVSPSGFSVGSINSNGTVTYASSNVRNRNNDIIASVEILGRENLSIAFGSYIEDASGGSNHDLIVGNMRGNSIYGLAGNDIIIGDGLAIAELNAALMGVGRLSTGVKTEGVSSTSDADYRIVDAGGVGDVGFEMLEFFADRKLQVDKLFGGGGNDVVSGAAGDDFLYGEAGNDFLYGGDGVDRLEGGDGVDHLIGWAGNDKLVADFDDDDDELWGGSGNDTVVYKYDGIDGITTLSEGAPLPPNSTTGPQTPQQFGLTVNRGSGATGTGTDTLLGIELAAVEAGSGNDEFRIVKDAVGVNASYIDYIDLGSQPVGARDSINASSWDADISIDLDANVVQWRAFDFLPWGFPLNTTSVNVRNAELAIGGNGDDLLRAGNSLLTTYELRGGAGDDTIYGGNGGSIIYGGADDDVVVSGKGTSYVIDYEGINRVDARAQTGRIFLTAESWNEYQGLSFNAGLDAKAPASAEGVSNAGLDLSNGGTLIDLAGNTGIYGAGVNDRLTRFDFHLYGGVQQWWNETGIAVASPWLSLLSAFPFVGAQGLFSAAIIQADVKFMKFAKYKVEADTGDLVISMDWGLGSTARIHDYDIDLQVGRGDAGITVFKQGKVKQGANSRIQA